MRPKVGITFALHMAWGEDPIPPGGLRTDDGIFLVIHAIVAEDFGMSGIGSHDLTTAMHDTLGLVKVHGFGNIVRDDGIVLPPLRNTINLNGQRNGNPDTLQIPREQHCRGGPPAVTEKDDPRVSFFLRAENPVVVSIEQSQHSIKSVSPAAVLKNLNISAVGNSAPDLLGKDHGPMMLVFMADETAHETDDDGGWNCI